MDMYFLRHGDSSSDSRCSDSERPLTNLGIHQASFVGTFLQRMNVVIDAALSSPLTRAQETTSLVLLNNNTRKVSISELLLNGSDPQQLFDRLNEINVTSVLLVGHEPYLSETISLLIGGDRGVEIEMKKCSLALVNISLPIRPGSGKLKFLIPVETIA